MIKSVHDNFIVSYEVKCEGREIRMETEYRDRGDPFERTTIVFGSVEAYDFKHDCLGNIIFDLEEVTAESILEARLADFQEGHRLSGWPRFWRHSLDEVRRYLSENGVRGYELSTSYGMSGWVLAREMEMIQTPR